MNLLRRFKRQCYTVYFTVKSLSYNASRPRNHYIDSLFEPLFWFVDNFTSYMGIIFVIAVSILTTSVVVLWYLFLLPAIKSYSTPWMLFHIVYAHYLLINIVFHYFKAVLTHPGAPPQRTPMENIPGSVVCKKCIQPKPPRTHHCSICNECYLKMDHHCPWMNNCIGFYNHRYFVSFCLFMWLGTIYVSLSTYDLFTYHFYHPETLLGPQKRAASLSFLFGLGPMIDSLLNSIKINGTSLQLQLEGKIKDYRPHPAGLVEVHAWEHIGIIYLFLLCSAVTVALSLLNAWHTLLITRGETSIEVHINSSECTKAAKSGMGYNNPYNYGAKRNLQIFFGLQRSGRSILCVLFPSSQKPEGDGFSWPDNKKPVNYPDPLAYERYERNKKWRWRKYWPC